MYQINLEKIPNQVFTTNINDISYKIELRFNEVMYFSLYINDKLICNNVICFANQKILPYRWQEKEAKGNFFFHNENDEYPNYENFNKTDLFQFVELDLLKENNLEY